MIKGGETPYDELTGVPIALPLLPNGLEGIHSWHHAAHPRDHELLQDTGGMAVRVARMQRVEGPGGTAATLNEANDIPENAGIHHRYHQNYIGPPLPENDSERFGYCVMTLAGYVPAYGIDFSGKYPFERRVNPEELKLLRGGELRVGSYGEIQRFFAEYLLFNAGSEHFDSRDLDDFLNSDRGAQRFSLGNRMINSVALDAVQPWVRPYKRAKSRGLLDPAASPSVLEVVRGAFGKETTRQGYIERMYQKIASPALQTEVKVVPSLA